MPDQPDRKLVHLLERVSFDPVFIIGDHRSGTTLLYKILADSGSFQVLNAYHIVHYDEILFNHQAGREQEAKHRLAARFGELGISDRIIDSVPASPDTPEEYGFALEDSRRPHVRSANHARMVEICRKLQFTQTGNKALLLKNPWDALSFADLKTFFPGARFVFLHRHPLGVINSQLRAIRSLMSVRNEYTILLAQWYARLWRSPMRLALMRATFAKGAPWWRSIIPPHVLRANRYFAENVGKIPAEDRISITYEDLCRSPRETVGKLLGFLRVRPEVALAYESMISQRDPELLPEISQRRKQVLSGFQPYLAAHGYGE
jgi:Sulfotransferase family